MFNVVGGEHSIHRGAGHGGHVCHGADHIRLYIGVDVEADFPPIEGSERGLVFVLRAATHMQDGAAAWYGGDSAGGGISDRHGFEKKLTDR